jgi:phosphoribosyl 1,2-cyclic phosphodiesterase
MEFSCLASGSSGNCFFVNEGSSSILIDAGISAKQIVERLNVINKNPKTIKGIFISHEHSDHVRGIDVFARKFNIPIFATGGTIKHSFLCSDEKLINQIFPEKVFNFSGFKVIPIKKSHDAQEPVSFMIQDSRKKTLSVLTDVGFACNKVIKAISLSDSLILESNHDVEMLESGKYPYVLKRRILSDKGHLSNFQAGLLLMEHSKPGLNNIILSHLSLENNTEELALETISTLIKHRKDISPKIFISTRHRPTPLILV